MIGSPARYNRCCKSSAKEERIRIHGVIFAAESAAYHTNLLGQYRDQYSKIALNMFDLAERTRGFGYVRATRERAALTIRLLCLCWDINFLSLSTLPALTPDTSAGTIRIGSCDVDLTMDSSATHAFSTTWASQSWRCRGASFGPGQQSASKLSERSTAMLKPSRLHHGWNVILGTADKLLQL